MKKLGAKKESSKLTKPVLLQPVYNVPEEKVLLMTDIPIPKQAQGQNQQLTQQGPIDFSKLLTFKIESRYPKIHITSQEQIVPIMVTCKAEDTQEFIPRFGLDLVMVIDSSGSMFKEGKMRMVKETVKFLIGELDERDRISLIKFNDQSTILTPLTPMTPENKKEFTQMVTKQLRPKGQTDINGGLKDACEMLIRRSFVNNVSALFLLSDGVDTSDNDNNSFLRTLRYYFQEFKRKKMDVRINSFGYGEDHDEKLLSMISGFHKGSFYYIKNLELVDECFIECLGYLMSLFANSALIIVSFQKPGKFVKTFGNVWKGDAEKEKLTITLDGLAIGVQKNFLALISVFISSKTKKGSKLVEATLEFECQGKKYNLKAELVLEFILNGTLGQPCQSLEENLLRVQAAEAIKKAQGEFGNGKENIAKKTILDCKSLVKSNKIVSPEYQAKIDAILEENIFAKPKEAAQVNEVLSKQAYAPGYINVTEMNSVQKGIITKKKAKKLFETIDE